MEHRRLGQPEEAERAAAAAAWQVRAGLRDRRRLGVLAVPAAAPGDTGSEWGGDRAALGFGRRGRQRRRAGSGGSGSGSGSAGGTSGSGGASSGGSTGTGGAAGGGGGGGGSRVAAAPAAGRAGRAAREHLPACHPFDRRQEVLLEQDGQRGGRLQLRTLGGGNGTGCMTVFGVDANFSATWTNVEDFLARVGLTFDRSKTPAQIGTISADFAETKTGDTGLVYVGIYGWTVDPLREYYILDDWGATKPAGIASDGTPRDSVGTIPSTAQSTTSGRRRERTSRRSPATTRRSTNISASGRRLASAATSPSPNTSPSGSAWVCSSANCSSRSSSSRPRTAAGRLISRTRR